MKVRSSFVTNSSSSSFVVAFNKVPLSAEELKAILFPSGESRVEYYDHSITTDAAAQRVFDDMQNQVPNDLVKIGDILTEGRLEDEDFIDLNGEPDWDAQAKALTQYHVIAAEEFVAKHKGTIFCFEYADDGGEAALEHGGIFDGLPHHVRSNH